MIGDVLKFYKNELTLYLNKKDGENKEVNFPTYGKNTGSINFHDESLNVMLINLEEIRLLQQPKMYTTEIQEKSHSDFPRTPLILYLLFVANNENYLNSLDTLSLVIKYFQTKNTFNHINSPDLPDGLEKLTAELYSVDFEQQNEIWNSLRTSYKPSALYRISMIFVYQ